MNVINPAYAGVDNQTQISGSIRSQWTSVKRFSTNASSFFGTSLGKNLGFGISVLNDQIKLKNKHLLGSTCLI
jgi:hypothetical protein